jgi:hypothetical protein
MGVATATTGKTAKATVAITTATVPAITTTR